MDFKAIFIKNPFSFITISGLICLSSIQVHADQRPVFSEVPGAEQSKVAPANPLIVKRQRPVAIQSEALQEDINALNLNLFDDANFKVIKDRIKQSRKNQYTWKGHIDGMDKSEVVLVMDPTTKQMSGTVNTPDRCYHIRPDGQGEHVVQEIDPFLTKSSTDEQPLENVASEGNENSASTMNEEEGETEKPLHFDEPEENAGETVVEDQAGSDTLDNTSNQRRPFFRASRDENIAHFNKLMKERYRWYLHHRRHHRHHPHGGRHDGMFDPTSQTAEEPGNIRPGMPVEDDEMAAADPTTSPTEEANTPELPVEQAPVEEMPVEEMAETDTTTPPAEEANTPELPVEQAPVEEIPVEEIAETDTALPIEEANNTPEIPVEVAPVQEQPVDESTGLDAVPTEDETATNNTDDLQNTPTSTPNAAANFEQQVLALVNQERAIRNLHPLVMNTQLTQSARAHSADMAQLNYFSHTSLDGRSPGDRIEDAGYQGNAWGENIAFGQTSPEEVMNSWMNSPGHAANILHRDFCDIGVGYEPNGRYWTQNFGRKQGVSQCQ